MAKKLKVGQIAPDFSALDQDETRHSLCDYKGGWLLLYFYPKDNTPGCTMEACNFRDHFDSLFGKLQVLGVSGDSLASHRRFAKKYRLPFPLLADPSKQIITSYGADGITFPKRVSFLINPTGTIAKIYQSVDPKTHAQEICQDFEKRDS